MGYRSSKTKNREQLSGRKFIIVIAIITSSLSFTLGYFVGKAGIKEKLQSQIVAVPQQQVITPVIQEQPAQISEQTTESTQPQSKDVKSSSEKTIPVQTPPTKKGIVEIQAKEDNPVQDLPKYTVQAGAFKSLKDADALKRKLEKKGHKTYIKKSLSTKNLKVFKVRTGEFVNKEDAETLASRLKKEGLDAFVTSKNEEAHGNDSGQSRVAGQEKTRQR